MNKKELILAAFSPEGEAQYSPAQAQKLIFLIQKKFPAIIEAADKFNFIAYDYGPFAKEVYETLRELKSEGMIEIINLNTYSWPFYKLTSAGVKNGQNIFSTLKIEEKNYMKETSQKIRNMSFSNLIAYIYEESPEMKKKGFDKNSVQFFTKNEAKRELLKVREFCNEHNYCKKFIDNIRLQLHKINEIEGRIFN